MKRFLLVGLLSSLSVGCGTLRDATVYATEVQYVDLTVSRSAPAVRHFLQSSCACDAETVTWTSTSESVTSETCEANADWYRTYSSRWAWHVAMMRFNGSLEGAVDPGPVPEVPRTCDLGGGS